VIRRLSIALLATALLLVFAQSAGAAQLYIPGYGSGAPEKISGYSLGADGTPTPLGGSPFAVGPTGAAPAGIWGLGFTPDGTRAVTGFEFSGGVLAMTAGADGALFPAEAAKTSPSVEGVAVTPDGRFAYTSTRTFPPGTEGKGIIGYAIGADGALTQVSEGATGEQFFDIAITPDGRFLYGVEFSSIRRFAIGADGKLTGPVNTGVSGQSLQVSPDGRFLFSTANSSSVVSYAIGADGSLKQVGEPLKSEGSSFGYFAVASDGRHLYVPDYNGKDIATVAVAPNGALSAAAGSTPIEDAKAAAVTPDGRYLYYARPNEGDIGVAAIGPDGVPQILPATAKWKSGESERLAFRPGPAPTASFSFKAGTAGSATSFDASGSRGAARYEWNFGDGTTLADGGPTPSHTYSGAGTYTVKLTVYDSLGCSTQNVYTGQTTVCPGGAGAERPATVSVPPPPSGSKPAPRITSFKLTRTSFLARVPRHSKQKPGTTFVFGLSAPAHVTLSIERKIVGRRVDGHCKPKSRKNLGRPRCVAYRSAGPALEANGAAGGNTIVFNGRLKGRPLAPGTYRAALIATDAAGQNPDLKTATFTVKASSRRARPGA
jgi:6-phosphogluconolactonase (cycloisomerase 2 family)